MGLLRRIETVTPLLIIPVIIYGVMSLLAGSDHGPDGPAILGMLNSTLISMPMISGVRWILTAGDALLVLSLIVLSIEIMKSTSTRSSAMINHVASMFVLLFCIVMFLLVGNFATGVFFLLTLITLMDVLVGVIVSIVSARRDFGVGDGFAG
ncbi:hypothetical protein [Henriciella litoralis]|uniref:hypothetical protein n=1 Tax=Henriciella litoralis TaxID=568102 RepID=UPI001F3EF02E|nr:hypothetical protein [Henriciella litoralis]